MLEFPRCGFIGHHKAVFLPQVRGGQRNFYPCRALLKVGLPPGHYVLRKPGSMRCPTSRAGAQPVVRNIVGNHDQKVLDRYPVRRHRGLPIQTDKMRTGL
jgi:hypothetical protein